jgi:HSP20 family molecular chaperone IbpA
MKLLQNKLVMIMCSFLLGGLSTYFITDYIRMKSHLETKEVASTRNKTEPTQSLSFKGNKNKNDPFAQMDKMHDQMRKRMGKAFGGSLLGGSMFDNNFFNADDLGDMSSDGLRIEEHEDDDFKYVEIIADGIDKDSININISNGMISVSGEIKKTEDNQGQSGRSMSSFVSKFSRSFNIPYGVSEENVKIETEENKIVIKFSKDRI